MKHDQHLVTKGWEDYELLDSGENMKLERFGSVVLARPETEALWAKNKPELWADAHATFAFVEGKGKWQVRKEVPDAWELARGPIKFLARLGNFKHTGIFPEQEPNWVWVKDRVKGLQGQIAAKKSSDLPSGSGQTIFSQPALSGPSVLNLFGYTGIATLAAAHAGAHVTHVDASKQSLDWAHENAKLTGLAEDAVRWMPDDALAFAKREVRRGIKYDGIILDPPAFGRGGKGEVWKIEEDLPALLAALKELLAETPSAFFLLNGYAAGYAPLSFAQAVQSVFALPDVALAESGELRIQESQSERAIPAGIYVRFVR